MTIPCPSPQWPSGLLEAGPEQDPTILLRGMAEISDAAYELLAIRIDPTSMKADLRGNVQVHAYSKLHLTGLLDDLSAFTDISDRSLVHLSSGAYVMLVFPAADT